MLEGQGGIHQLQQAQLDRMLVTMLILELHSLQPSAGPPSVEKAPETVLAPVDHYFKPLNEYRSLCLPHPLGEKVEVLIQKRPLPEFEGLGYP